MTAWFFFLLVRNADCLENFLHPHKKIWYRFFFGNYKLLTSFSIRFRQFEWGSTAKIKDLGTNQIV